MMGKLTVEDCMCPICMCIFVEPVTMPCSHTLCMACFKQNVEETNLTCPMCRTRISVWSRRATKSGTLVNMELWSQIKDMFPDKVEKRLAGEDDEDDDDEVYQPFISIAEPGEIRREYEEQLKRLAEQREKEKQKEQEASEALIRKLQEEEDAVVKLRRQQQKTLEDKDNKLAKELNSVIEEAGTDAPFSFLMEESKRRMTRSASTVSSASCSSAASSRAASTIESFIHKMREAEKLKEADRVPGIKSPYPYCCYSPTEKGKSSKEGHSASSAGKSDTSLNSSLNVKSRSNTSLDYDMSDLQCEDEGIFAEHLVRDFSSKSNSSSVDVEIVAYSKGTGSNSKSKSETVVRSPFVDLTGTPGLEMDSKRGIKSPEVEMLTRKFKTDEKIRATPLDRFLQRHGSRNSRTGSSQSNDSIGQELNHFKPIKVCPLTPPKKLANGKVVETQIIRTTPRNLSKTGFSPPHNDSKTLSDIDASSPIMQRRLSELEEERKLNVRRMSKSTSVSNENRSLSASEMLPSGDQKTLCSFSPVGKRKNKELTLDDHVEWSSSPDDCSAKKLVIPLESNIDDVMDFDIPPPLSVNNNISNIDVGKTLLSSQHQKLFSCSESSEKNVSRKKQDRVSLDSTLRDKSGKLKGKHELYSPQRSITEWIKRSDSCKVGRSSSDLHSEAIHVVHCGRDEVDGNINLNLLGKPRKERRAKDGYLDTFVSSFKDKTLNSSLKKHNTRQVRKRTKQSDDYIYPDLSPRKKKEKVIYCSEDEMSEESDFRDEMSGISRVTDDSLESVSRKGREKRRHLFLDTDSTTHHEKKRRKLSKSGSSSSSSSRNSLVSKKLKSLKTVQKHNKKQPSRKANHLKKESKYWTFEPVCSENATTDTSSKLKESRFWKYVPVCDVDTKESVTETDFKTTETDYKTKPKQSRFWTYVPVCDNSVAIQNSAESSECSPEPRLDSNCNVLGHQSRREFDKDQQEAVDKMLALKLAKQFEIEAKFRLGSLRFKGEDGEYNLRKKAQC